MKESVMRMSSMLLLIKSLMNQSQLFKNYWDFTRRGGVKMTATVYRGKDQDNWPEYKMNPL